MSATIKINQKTPAGLIVPEAQIRTDLTAIAAYAKSVRPYASTQGLERVPPIAAELGHRRRSIALQSSVAARHPHHG